MTGYERITWLYEQLKAQCYPCRADFMACFEVSESTFKRDKRDIAFLRDRLAAPLEYDQNLEGYYLTDQSFELPSFWFDHQQLLLIAAVCRQLEQFSHSAAMAKLRQRLLDMLTLRGGRHLDIFSFENAPCVACDNENFDLLS
ncbi:MAG: WYL domain-containing protein, partial [Deltaproteobacteria bacterium]|nr:WYL domain-containing protein [Deltaproteobacteria bacterium]